MPRFFITAGMPTSITFGSSNFLLTKLRAPTIQLSGIFVPLSIVTILATHT